MVKIMHTHFDEYKDNAPGAGGWTLDRQKFEQAFVLFMRAPYAIIKRSVLGQIRPMKIIREICIGNLSSEKRGTSSCLQHPMVIRNLRKLGLSIESRRLLKLILLP